MPSAQRLIILPDSTRAIWIAICGCSFTLMAAAFHSEVGGFGFILGTVGVFFIAYVLTTQLRPLPLPRIEINDDGITWLALFHCRKIPWSEIDGIEHRWKVIDDTYDHDIRIWLAGGVNDAGQDRRHFDMHINIFLGNIRDSFAVASALSHWLSEIRSSVASGTSVLAHSQRPARVRCVVA